MSNIISGDIDNIHCRIVGVGLVKNCRFPQTISGQNPPLPYKINATGHDVICSATKKDEL